MASEETGIETTGFDVHAGSAALLSEQIETRRAVSVQDGFQDKVGIWADATFPLSTVDSVSAHLADEVLELVGPKVLVNALQKHFAKVPFALWEKPSDEEAMFEAADVFLLLLHFAFKLRRSLMGYAIKKYNKNMSRKWGTADERNVVKHVEEPAAVEEQGHE